MRLIGAPDRARAGASLAVAIAVLTSVVVVSPAGADARPGRTHLVAAGGARPSISGDGRFVAFLRENGTTYEILVADRQTGVEERITRAMDGGDPDDSSGEHRISRDGRYVVFVSRATNLVAGDTNGMSDAFLHDRHTGLTERISVGPNGEQMDTGSPPTGTGSYKAPAVSPDGRHVAFVTDESLVPNDRNEMLDIYVRDRLTGTLEVLPTTPDGGSPDGASMEPAFSADGRLVTFMSEASNLVPGDGDRSPDIFVYDRTTRRTDVVSVSTAGELGNGASRHPSISADGRYVAFMSYASNLVPGDLASCRWPDYSINCSDVFVHDRLTGRTERVSVASDGTEADGFSGPGRISSDGRFVVFVSEASSLRAEEPLGEPITDVYVHDRLGGSTERVSLGPSQASADLTSSAGTISADGRFVAFTSGASNLVPNWNRHDLGLYVRDRGELVDVQVEPFPGDDDVLVRGWARLGPRVLTDAFDSSFDGGPAAVALGGELTGARIAVRPERKDLFVRVDVALIPAVHSVRPLKDVSPGGCFDNPTGCLDAFPGTTGTPGIVWGLEFVLDGVAYQARAARSLEGSFALFRCTATCERVASLRGGLGTGGEAITLSIPLHLLDPSDDGAVTGVTAFSALGDVEAGPLARLDERTLFGFSLPTSTVRLGVAPEGTLEDDVAFDIVSDLDRGEIWERLPRDPGDGPHEIWAKACVATTCTTRRVEVPS